MESLEFITARFMWIVSESLNKSILTSFSKLFFFFLNSHVTYVCEKFASTNRNDSILQISVIYMHHQLINTNYHVNILRYLTLGGLNLRELAELAFRENFWVGFCE